MADQLKWRLRTGLVLTLAMAMLVTSPFMALAGERGDEFIVEDARMESAKMIAPLATIELDNGDEIMFTPMPDERGRTADVLVSGVRSGGRIPTSSIEGLRDANPLELFVALARPGARIPAALLDLYREDSSLGQQGWARDMAIATDPQYVTCPAYYWQDQMDAFANAFNDDDPFKSSWDGPSTKPQHWSSASNAPADGKLYYDLHGQANDVTAFYGAVIYCVEDFDNASTYNGVYVGNYVTSHYRLAGTGTWHFSGQAQLTDVGDMYEHIYSPGNKFSPGATKYDFHIEIQTAKPADEFHIGATWVYGGPTDIKYGG
jgi:hypothetical protein